MDRAVEIMDMLNNDNNNFLARAQQELKRAQRYLSFISYIYIDTGKIGKNGDGGEIQSNNGPYTKLRGLLRQTIRQTDLISGFRNGKICILLVETEKQNLDIVKGRIQETIKYFLHEIFDSPLDRRVDIKSGSFPDGDITPASFLNSIQESL